MVLIAEAQQLKAKLMLKGKFRPEKMVRKKMPDGSGMLAKLPERRKDDGLDAAAADKEYCDEFLLVVPLASRYNAPRGLRSSAPCRVGYPLMPVWRWR